MANVRQWFRTVAITAYLPFNIAVLLDEMYFVLQNVMPKPLKRLQKFTHKSSKNKRSKHEESHFQGFEIDIKISVLLPPLNFFA